ncbi:MAG TPA: GNAT family N-acetyltransferase [Thermomicrobiaceae bacterium]|nr:GNAT family N-acetyltransferase [Thermomicrobiaceae bacterium]
MGATGRDVSAGEDLTDGVIALRPLTLDDADAHLAGEDEQQVRWLNDGGHSTPQTVQRHIERMLDARRRRIALWSFGVIEVASGDLVGNVEGNGLGTLVGVGTGEANISYVIYPDWRGRGYAVRAVLLLCDFLRQNGIDRAIIRVHPDNVASQAVARRAGFVEAGHLHNRFGPLLRFVRTV